MKKILATTFKWLIALYILICILLYFFQEKLIFFPQKLARDFKFSFDTPFEEVNFKMKDDVLVNGILFKANNPKGLIFYLHGNAGSIDSWGDVAKTYTDLNYDVLIIDYRGYGKSEGKISSEKQLFDDLQIVYDNMKEKYEENKIIILGYSIGSGLAARTASVNNPRMLILQAPYYNLTDMMRHSYPIIPTFLLKYKFQTNKFIKECKMPVTIFHGDRDEVIYYGSSLKLRALFKSTDTLITLKGQAHNDITENPEYRNEIARLLER